MIAITGDTHGDVSRLAKIASKSDANVIIVTGDFGVIFNNKKDTDTCLGILANFTAEFYTVLGNHEQYDIIYKLPVVQRFGGPVYQASENVFYFQNGQVYNIEDYSTFVFGGAWSIDGSRRIWGRSKWRQEIPSKEMYETGLVNITNDSAYDLVLTHTAPSEAIKGLQEIGALHDDKTVRQMFGVNDLNCEAQNMLDKYAPMIPHTLWYCGHFHINHKITVGHDYHLLFNDTVILEEKNGN